MKLLVKRHGGWWLVSLGLMGGLLVVEQAGWMKRLEWLAEDGRIKVREMRDKRQVSGEVVLLEVDELSLAEHGRWPFPRPTNGMLMEFAGKGEEGEWPSVMVWDILFTERIYETGMDQEMAAAVGRAGYPVVLGAVFDESAVGGLLVDRRPVLDPGLTQSLARVEGKLAELPDRRGGLVPVEPLLDVAEFAFLNADADSDGVVRRLPLVVRVGEEVYPSLVLGGLMKHWGAEVIEIVPGDRLTVRLPGGGERRVPMDGAGYFRVNYRFELMGRKGGVGAVPTVSYAEVLNTQIERFLLMNEEKAGPGLGGKLVLVGQTASGLTDIGPSPLRGQSAKVLFHFNALENILAEDYLRGTSMWPWLGLVLLAGGGAGWLLDRKGLKVYAWGVVGLLGVGLVGAQGLLEGWNLMVPVSGPLVGFFVQQAYVTGRKIREEQAKRDRIRGMFSAYVAPALVNRMVDRGEEPQLGGVETEITAYFSDIESFSSFSEKLGPTQLVELMNEYLSACTDILQAEGGTLDKYIGDAVVAMYGAPLVLPGHAHRAVVAALRVHRRCDELRAKWLAEKEVKGWPEIVTNLQTRIGLNTGPAVVGNMGSHTRFNYTMMGDTVNLAARMESGAKVYGVYTMVTEQVVKASEAEEPGAVLFRPLDRIVVKGRTQPVSIYEAVALKEDVTSEVEACVSGFRAGFEAYYAQDWERAMASFAESAKRERHPKNNPSLVLGARAALMQAHPPGPSWDGVFTMTSK